MFYQSIMKNLQCSLYCDHSGFVQVIDNVESHGIYFSISRARKSWNLSEGPGTAWKAICFWKI